MRHFISVMRPYVSHFMLAHSTPSASHRAARPLLAVLALCWPLNDRFFGLPAAGNRVFCSEMSKVTAIDKHERARKFNMPSYVLEFQHMLLVVYG